MKAYFRPWIIPALLTVVTLICVWHDFSRPAFWDEPKVYFRPLFALYENFWVYLKTPPTLYDRPLGLHFFYLPFLYLFGPSVVLIRILNFFFAVGGLWLFYFTVAKQYRLAVAGSWILVLLTPVTRVYLIDYVCEYQLFFFISLTFYLLECYPQKIGLIFCSAFAAAALRESGLVLVPAILLYGIIKRTYPRGILLLLAMAPVLGLVPHWARNYWLTGNFFHHLTIEKEHLVILQGLSERGLSLLRSPMASYRLWPLIVSSAVVSLYGFKQLKWTVLERSFAIIVFSFAVVFSGHVIGIPRYYMPMMPLLFYLLILPGWQVFQLNWQRLIFFSIMFVGSVMTGDPTTNLRGPFAHHTGLHDGTHRSSIVKQHITAIAATKAVLNGQDVVTTSWPFFEMLRSPYLGHGPVRGQVLNRVTMSVPPKAILWTDFPKQISDKTLAQWLQRAHYQRHDFSYGRHHVLLFVRDDTREDTKNR